MKKYKILKKTIASVFSFAFIVLSTFALTSCNEKDNVASLWSSNYASKRTPVIESVSPEQEPLAGITTVVITGKNFSTVPSENLVFFNSTFGKVLTATETRLEVLCPNNTGDSVLLSEKLKIAVSKSQLYSNVYNYRVRSAIVKLADLTASAQVVKTSTVDKNSDVFVAIEGTNGVKKVNHATGEITTFVPSSGTDVWQGMKFGANHEIYAVNNKGGIFLLKEGVSTGNTPWVSSSKTVKVSSLVDLDFDKNGNIWCGGSAKSNSGGTDKKPKVFKVTKDKVLTAYDYDQDVVAVRVFNDYVYFASKTAVYRCHINSSSDLEAKELYYDYSKSGLLGEITSFSFSEGGDMYLGIANVATVAKVQPIIVVSAADKSIAPLYDDIIFTNANSSYYLHQLAYMSWGSGEPGFYISRQVFTNTAITTKPSSGNAIIYVYVGKKGAPLYGNSL